MLKQFILISFCNFHNNYHLCNFHRGMFACLIYQAAGRTEFSPSNSDKITSDFLETWAGIKGRRASKVSLKWKLFCTRGYGEVLRWSLLCAMREWTEIKGRLFVVLITIDLMETSCFEIQDWILSAWEQRNFYWTLFIKK